MGKIIRNGIEFSGTTDTANNINYDNSVSGLEARTAQGAIDELTGSVNELNEIGARLWSGSFTEGSITVPNLNKYRIIAVSVEGVLCFGTKSFGGTCVPLVGQLGIVNYAYRFSYNGDVLTINDNNKGGTNGTSQKAIQAIYGIVLN